MKLKHRINIHVEQPDGREETMLKGGEISIRERFLRFLLGERLHVLVVSPGNSVTSVDIIESKVGGSDSKGGR